MEGAAAAAGDVAFGVSWNLWVRAFAEKRHLDKARDKRGS